MASLKKYTRKAKSCYRANVTLTFKHPVTVRSALYLVAQTMQNYNSFVDYVWYPELGDDNCHIHFHGTVYYTNALHFSTFVNRWKCYHGFVKISSPNDNFIGWHIYCRKEQYKFCGQCIVRAHAYNKNKILIKYSPFI